MGEEGKKMESKEGSNLLGSPTFTQLENGRFKCVETGHEMLAKDKDSYSQSKRCRLGLVDFALANNKPPLNMFKQDPLSRSKLICELTGDTVNKSEEHIWKHISGKRFLNKLEQKEMKKLESDGTVAEQVEEELKSSQDGDKKRKKKKKKQNKAEEIISQPRDSSDDSDLEETDIWIPPVGERWDFDDGGDRWGSDAESEHESQEENAADDAVEDNGKESEEISKRTKRMSIDIGPSSYASRKKKSKKDTIS